MKSHWYLNALLTLMVSMFIHADSIASEANAPSANSIKVSHSVYEWSDIAKVTPQQAVETVFAKEAGKLLEVQLEGEGGFLIYDVEIVTKKGEIKEFQIDAVNGKFLGENEEDEEKDDDESDIQQGSFALNKSNAEFPDLAKIGPWKAMETATTQTGGKFIGLELTRDDGYLIYEIIVVTPGFEIKKIEIDAGSGFILEVEELDLEEESD